MKKTINVPVEFDAAKVADNLIKHGISKPGEEINYLELRDYIMGYVSGAVTSNLDTTGKYDQLEAAVRAELKDKQPLH